MTIGNEKQKIWKDQYIIRSFDSDVDAKAGAPALCRLMQESAYHHVANLGMGYQDLIEQQSAWVLSRQYLRILRAPAWGENVTLATWNSNRERLFWFREFEMTDIHGGLVFQAATAWIVVNVNTRRPQRNNARAVNDAYSCKRHYPDKPQKLPALTKPETILSLHPGYFDLDVVGHVNNTRYVEWILGALDAKHHQVNTLKELDINYLSETRQGQTLEVRVEHLENGVLGHDIIRREDGKEVIRVRSTWEPKAP